MDTLKTQGEIEKLVEQIESELTRLGWLTDIENPWLLIVDAEQDLPNGWVKLADDQATGFGPAEEILEVLKATQGNTEYLDGLGFVFETKRPSSSRDWPENLIELEKTEQLPANEDPLTLITVGMNAGVRFAFGPHGVDCCALESCLKSDDLDETREGAMGSLWTN